MKQLLLTKYGTGFGLGLTLLTATATAGEPGALYTIDNAATANHVLVFQRAENGELTSAGAVDTGGTGTGAGLSSQGAVLLSRDGRWLLVCNAGSSEISVFAVSRRELTLTDKVPSGGQMPVSLTLRHNLLYVLNAGGGAGGQDNITAFNLADGRLEALPNSTQTLSANNTGPAQVSFTQRGDVLVVTERLTSLIDTFVVGDDGLASDLKSFLSVGTTPFGFGVGRENRIFVSEAATGSASAYEVSEDGDLTVISGAVPTHQAAPCWAIASRTGRFVYTANAGSGSVSGFHVEQDGALQLLTADGRTGVTGNGSHPVDMVESRDGRFLYSLNNGNGTISAFKVHADGTLQSLSVVSGIPTSAAGLAGR